MLISYLLVLCLLMVTIYHLKHACAYFLEVKQTLLSRLHRLSTLAKDHLPQVSLCSNSSYIIITGDSYGGASNVEIEFINGLWLSQHYNRTLVLPQWMNKTLHPFHLNRLHDHFCFISEDPREKKDVIWIKSSESYFLEKLFLNPGFKSSLPAFNEQVFQNIAKHYLLTFSAIWSAPARSIINATAWLIRNKLHGFNYTAVHKRSFEGGCSEVFFSRHIGASAFDPTQIDVTHASWKGNLLDYNPLCDMNASFVQGTMKLNHREGQSIYVCFDGQGSMAELNAINATSLTSLDPSFNDTLPADKRKFVDVFAAINSDLFILNLYSTLSFQINIVRIALGLESVPRLSKYDMYLSTEAQQPLHHLWLNPDAILAANQRLKKT